MTSHFATLSLPQTFPLDEAALEVAYLTAQRKYHPDRYATKPAEERLAAAQKSADINQAYAVLKTPLTRAKHLLQLAGIHVLGEQDTLKPSQALIMEVIEWREDAEGADAHGREQLGEKLQAEYAKTVKTLEEAFANNGLNQAAEYTVRLAYLAKTLQELQLN